MILNREGFNHAVQTPLFLAVSSFPGYEPELEHVLVVCSVYDCCKWIALAILVLTTFLCPFIQLLADADIQVDKLNESNTAACVRKTTALYEAVLATAHRNADRASISRQDEVTLDIIRALLGAGANPDSQCYDLERCWFDTPIKFLEKLLGINSDLQWNGDRDFSTYPVAITALKLFKERHVTRFPLIWDFWTPVGPQQIMVDGYARHGGLWEEMQARWLPIEQWPSTMKEAEMTFLCVWVKFFSVPVIKHTVISGTDEDASDSMTQKLPFIPLFIWHHILSMVRRRDLGIATE